MPHCPRAHFFMAQRYAVTSFMVPCPWRCHGLVRHVLHIAYTVARPSTCTLSSTTTTSRSHRKNTSTPSSALQKVAVDLVVWLNNFQLQVTSPTRSLFLTLLETFTRSPLQEGQVFAGTLDNQSKLGKNLTKVWLRHCSRKTENQVMSTGESLTLEKKALCTKQPGYGETWCVKNALLGSHGRNTSREQKSSQERQLIHE